MRKIRAMYAPSDSLTRMYAHTHELVCQYSWRCVHAPWACACVYTKWRPLLRHRHRHRHTPHTQTQTHTHTDTQTQTHTDTHTGALARARTHMTLSRHEMTTVADTHTHTNQEKVRIQLSSDVWKGALEGGQGQDDLGSGPDGHIALPGLYSRRLSR